MPNPESVKQSLFLIITPIIAPKTDLSLLGFSDEILLEIFSYLDFDTLLKLRVTCKRLNLLLEDEIFWSKFIEKYNNTFINANILVNSNVASYKDIRRLYNDEAFIKRIKEQDPEFSFVKMCIAIIRLKEPLQILKLQQKIYPITSEVQGIINQQSLKLVNILEQGKGILKFFAALMVDEEFIEYVRRIVLDIRPNNEFFGKLGYVIREGRFLFCYTETERKTLEEQLTTFMHNNPIVSLYLLIQFADLYYNYKKPCLALETIQQLETTNLSSTYREIKQQKQSVEQLQERAYLREGNENKQHKENTKNLFLNRSYPYIYTLFGLPVVLALLASGLTIATGGTLSPFSIFLGLFGMKLIVTDIALLCINAGIGLGVGLFVGIIACSVFRLGYREGIRVEEVKNNQTLNLASETLSASATQEKLSNEDLRQFKDPTTGSAYLRTKTVLINPKEKSDAEIAPSWVIQTC